MKPIALEDHGDAYFAWKQLGVRQAWCWHVDTHLDIGRDGLDPLRLGALESCSTREQASGLCGDPFVPWGGLNCGNYLLPAIREGMVAGLTWVVPPGLVQGPILSWAREQLDGWLDLTVTELAGLQARDGYVEGTILGIPLVVGLAECVPPAPGPVLLDVDLDYWLDAEGELWEQPRMPDMQTLCVTFAFSVYGGYTPPDVRELGVALVGETPRPYTPGPLDRAAALVRQRQFSEALDLLDPLVDAPAVYLAGTARHQMGQYAAALQCWSRLWDQGALPIEGRAYVAGLAAESLTYLDRALEAQEWVQRALQLRSDDYRLHWAAAMACEKLGDLPGATRALRRGLQLAEPYVFGLRMRSVLARLYRLQGKQGLARMELERLERADLTGLLRPLTLLR